MTVGSLGEPQKKQNETKKRVVLFVSFFRLFCLVRSFLFVSSVRFFCLVSLFLFASFGFFCFVYSAVIIINQTTFILGTTLLKPMMLAHMSQKLRELTPYGIIIGIITPKAIILTHAAYNRRMLTPYGTYDNNNHAKGNNTRGCGAQSS